MDKTETNDLLEECMLYFKARPVYKKLFLKMRDKYAGLGHFGGTAMLTSLSREEKSQLGGFFQRDYTSNKTITISADLMKKCDMPYAMSVFLPECGLSQEVLTKQEMVDVLRI